MAGCADFSRNQSVVPADLEKENRSLRDELEQLKTLQLQQDFLVADLKEKDAKVSSLGQEIFLLKNENEVLADEKKELQGKLQQMTRDQERLKEDYFKECQRVSAYNGQVKYLLQLLSNSHAKTKKVLAQQTEVSARMQELMNS